MSKSPNQKLKLLYLKEILLRKTDDDHCLTVREMITELNKLGITAERKSIYNDIEALCNMGIDIITARGKCMGYFVGNRAFELPELKLLVDSVQASKFITPHKSIDLIFKLKELCSEYEAEKLLTHVDVLKSVKSLNESIFILIDNIYRAISENKKISFEYTQYTITKQKKPRKNGQKYILSPYRLFWDDENYYMLAYDSEAEIIKHYRVDKMLKIDILDIPRDGKDVDAKTDYRTYTRRIFGMFGGKEKSVRLKFSNDLIGVVIDRFGLEVKIVHSDEKSFEILVDVVVSPQFYGWLFNFGDQTQIIEPQEVVEEMKLELKKALAQY